MIDAISQPSLSYDAVLDLDRQIRDFSIPNHLRDKLGNSRCIVVQKASLSTALEAGTCTPRSVISGINDT